MSLSEKSVKALSKIVGFLLEGMLTGWFGITPKLTLPSELCSVIRHESYGGCQSSNAGASPCLFSGFPQGTAGVDRAPQRDHRAPQAF